VDPGEHLAEELKALGMGILNGHRALTGDTALRLGHFFSTSPDRQESAHAQAAEAWAPGRRRLTAAGNPAGQNWGKSQIKQRTESSSGQRVPPA
jgi:hypothetical protein